MAVVAYIEINKHRFGLFEFQDSCWGSVSSFVEHIGGSFSVMLSFMLLCNLGSKMQCACSFTSYSLVLGIKLFCSSQGSLSKVKTEASKLIRNHSSLSSACHTANGRRIRCVISS